MTREFEMTEAQQATLMEACKPVPYMVVGGVVPRSPQENANDAWAALGKEMGFKPMTARPVAGKGNRFFTAEPVEAPKPVAPDWRGRVIAEAAELSDRLIKLTAFLYTPAYNGLAEIERGDLLVQHGYMEGYLTVLQRRIARF